MLLLRRIDLTTRLISTVARHYVPDPVGLDLDGDGDYDVFFGLGGYDGDGGPATEATLNDPTDLAFGLDGTMYIADADNNCVRAVDLDGNISTFAGQCGVAAGPTDALGDGGDPTSALLNHPTGLEVDGDGNVYIADEGDDVVRVVWAP